ncbi:MATE family efflux transporter [Bacillus canaveralius]|uniref:MATE family efflux transporter n=1 Tax=Bacillus canaveralius TaxID=1403243 RepID=UPI000F7B24CD|nr:MATE family efflux transporter [Bacillus canaveralius]RSK51794.1 MATE family efflux transporter [Bacillus canaveralius]
MERTNSRKEKLKQLFVILLPILVTQLAMYGINFFDIMMSGHFSHYDLAGVAIGSSLWVPVFTGLSGILLAVTPIVAQLVGAKESKEASYSVVQGVYLSVVTAIFVIAVGSLILNPILNIMQLETEVREIARNYIIALSFGMIPLFVYNVLRSFIDALGKTRVTMMITLMAVPINVLFNYLFIFGKFGFPELGGVGAGIASAITYWLITLIAVFVIIKLEPFTQFGVFKSLPGLSLYKWKEILMIGVPIGFAIFFETSIFSAVTLLMSTFDTATIAAHQIAINFASFLYMIPLSISMALTIVVGFEVGAKRYRDAKEYSWIGIGLAVILSIVCGFILLQFRKDVAAIYTKDPEVLNLTIDFLIFALFFQLSDAIQAPVQGALRGYKDVNITLIMALFSYWVIGLPLGYILANYTDWSAFGYWVGLISGLAVGAVCLVSRLIFLQKNKLSPSLSEE